ncbi:MAG: hypothetical protein KF680_07170 [Cryobacterium sp.]|nr:hypothetical protein [Cryobacterium sp.]
MRKLLLASAVVLVLAGCSASPVEALGNCRSYMAKTAISKYKTPPDAETTVGWYEWAQAACETLLEEDSEGFLELWSD